MWHTHTPPAEAHKAQGNYAYCKEVQEIARHTRHFRVLALSATPGRDLKSVNEVLRNLLIKEVEVINEEAGEVLAFL